MPGLQETRKWLIAHCTGKSVLRVLWDCSKSESVSPENNRVLSTARAVNLVYCSVVLVYGIMILALPPLF